MDEHREAGSAAGVPQLNTWTHLTGVYEPDANEIRLFVDGKLAGTAPAPPAYAGGPAPYQVTDIRRSGE